MDSHDDAIAIIAANIRQFYDRKESFRIYHGSTNSTRQRLDRTSTIDISGLKRVLKVDKEKKTALVEPNVPMDFLVGETLKYGLVPPVVMEFPGITVGGGFAGTSGESSSFRYGFFDRTVNWIEMVLANGTVVKASDAENVDLFHGAAGAFGTLGVTTLLELQLIDAKKFVQLTYHPVPNTEGAIQKMKEATNDPSINYLDGILFSLSSGVVITGTLTDSLPPGTMIRQFTRPSDPWFYLHAQDVLTHCKSTPYTEAAPLVDYLFRYDRGAFWTGRYAYKYFLTPFNRLTRWLLDPFMHTRVMYHALHESGLSKRYIIQDLALPYNTAEAFVQWVDAKFKLYPLWLCPLRQSTTRSLHPHHTTEDYEDEDPKHSDMLLNIGVWGVGPSDRQAFVAANRELEHQVRGLCGMKWLYAHAYYTEDEFWSIYDRRWYETLRRKYDAENIPGVYEKVKVDVEKEEQTLRERWGAWTGARRWLGTIWPLSGLYGVWMTVWRTDYLKGR